MKTQLYALMVSALVAVSVYAADIPVAKKIKMAVPMVYDKYEKDNKLGELSAEFKDCCKKLKDGATALPAEEVFCVRQDLHKYANYDNIPSNSLTTKNQR